MIELTPPKDTSSPCAFAEQSAALSIFQRLFSSPIQSAHPTPIGPMTPMVRGSSLSSTSVPMDIEGGIYVVPVLINDAITLNFVVDSGATHVSIPADVVMTLMRTGPIKDSDFLGEQTYVLADGSKAPSQTFRIRSLKVGNKILENVIGSIASVKGGLLLGQSFLGRFKSWSIDNANHALLLSE
jgi:predicted aspartyl protease